MCTLLAGAPTLLAQDAVEPIRLPPVFYPQEENVPNGPNWAGMLDPAGVFDFVRLAATPEQTRPILDETNDPSPPQRAGKDGMLQDMTFNATLLPTPSTGDLGITDLSLSLSLGLPLPTRDHPLLITPAFQVQFLDGPAAPDLPGAVYSSYVQFRWLPKLSENWRLDLGVAPGVYSDFEIDDGDAFRLTGRGLAIWTWSEQTTWVLGVLFLDRPDINLLPAGGVLWTPSDDWRFELIFPEPRIAQRIVNAPGPRPIEYWLYVKGEFGGDAWSIRRASGVQDQIVLRDFRLIVGLERKLIGVINTRLEVGYVTGRTVEYHRTATPDFDPGDTALIRLGASY